MCYRRDTFKVVTADIERIFRSESRRVLATLIRLLGDFDRAEEAMQEAFRVAVEKWPVTGIPRNPAAWLISTGRFKGIDSFRRDELGSELFGQHFEHRASLADDLEDGIAECVDDDQHRLIFACCHPVLPLDARIALSLREVCGLTTEEIAEAYLVSADTIKKRISRVKAAIREKRIPDEIPTRGELKHRLSSVLHVAYLVYNAGYAASTGSNHTRSELTSEGLFLCRLIAQLVPDTESFGLLALVLFHEARVATRVNKSGVPVPLEDQDRSRWDRTLIREGLELLQQAMLLGRIGVFTVQAAIASVHAQAESLETTNWSVILSYYDALLERTKSPVVEMNRAIALAMRDGPLAGL
jgi:RNA polymerase sigma-70 factor (ECF subfamily)